MLQRWLKPNIMRVLADLKYRIYDLRAVGASGVAASPDGLGVLAYGHPTRRAGRRSRGRRYPYKALGGKVRWALLGFVGPKSLKKYRHPSTSCVRVRRGTGHRGQSSLNSTQISQSSTVFKGVQRFWAKKNKKI